MADQMIPGGKAGRDKERMTRRWRADLHIVETDDGQLHVATVSGGAVAEHIAELHNRTFGDGQEPPDGDLLDAALRNAAQDFAEQVPGADRALRYLESRAGRPLRGADGLRRAYLAGYAARSEEAAFPTSPHPDTAAFLATLNDPRMARRTGPPGPFVGDALRDSAQRPELLRWLGAQDTSGYLTKISEIVQREVDRRVTEYAARESAKISIAESPDAMVKILRDLGFIVTPAGEPTPAQPVIELSHRPAYNGVSLLIDGEEQVHVNDGDTGGAGLTLGVRALAGKLGLEVMEP